jgi:uncharacterized protein
MAAGAGRMSAESTFRSHGAQQLTILLTAHDQSGHGSLTGELLRRARRVGVRGATAVGGMEGFGASRQLHRTHLLGTDAPMAIVLVDSAERIEEFLQAARDLLGDALVTLSDVDVVEL